MANNYEEATLVPSIPKDKITDAEIAIMDMCGWDSEEDDNGTLYFFCENGMSDFEDADEEDQRMIADDPIWGGRDRIEFTEVLQKVLERWPEGRCFQVEGCYRCDRMRAGQFGGFAFFVTKDNVQFTATHDFLRACVTEMECGL